MDPMRDTRRISERSCAPVAPNRRTSRPSPSCDRQRREQTNRLLGLALQLHARKRSGDAIWFGRLAQALDPSNPRAAAYLRLFRSPLSLVFERTEPIHP
jgi:hypothetical protein